ncbi:MAG: NADP-dependent oxidoreductase [Actinomycetes bacterium]|jgi:NADPH:quinone reductase-like Zn-dependent oxidoreductase
MKAVRFHEYGDAGVLGYEEVERPVPGPGQVLVRVAATSFNPVDVALRAGLMQQTMPLTLPHTPGIDLAGTVAEVGPEVSGWNPGERVVAFLPLIAPGAAAEYVVAPANVLAAAPKTIDLVDAAALPTVGLTAWQALFEDAGLTAGRSILINGAGGAVGGYAVQLARAAGAEVTATASPRSADRVRRYGAADVIDYTRTPVAEAARRQFDVVLNLVPTTPGELARLARLVADDGVLVSATTPAVAHAAPGLRTAQTLVRADAAQLAELVARVDAGELHVHVADRRPLRELPEVHALAEQGRLPGKTVIVPEP